MLIGRALKGQSKVSGSTMTFTSRCVLLLTLICAISLASAQLDDDDTGLGSESGILSATSISATPTQTMAPGQTTTATSTTSATPAPTYTNVVLDLGPSYQPNFFIHQPLPDAYYGSAAHSRAPDIYFRDCNYHANSAKSVVPSDFRLNVTSVYAQFDQNLEDTYIGRNAPTKGTLRIVALGEIGAEAHAADNRTNYLSAISIQSSFLTFPVFTNFTFLCDRIFPTTADALNPLINPTSCAYGPGPVAFGVSIPINSPYYLGTISTQLRLSDPSKPAKNIACIQINHTPYRPHAWYWSFILWLPIATTITFFVVAALARLFTALAVLRARFANRAREGTGPNWVRDKLRPTLAVAFSGEHLQQFAGLLRFASPGCWDIIYHLQFVAAIAMVSVHWPEWAYPVLRQAAWASLLGNVTVLHSNESSSDPSAIDGYMPSGKIDVLRTFAAIPIGDVGDQMRNNLTSPLYMNTNLDPNSPSYAGGNRFLNLNSSAYGIPRYAYMIGLREEDLWPTAVVIWLYILAAVVGISAVLWLADWLHGIIHAAKQRRQADDLNVAALEGAGAGRGESSTAIMAPKSPAASTAASLNFGMNPSRPGTPGGGGSSMNGATPLTSTVRPSSRSSMFDQNRRALSSVSVGAGEEYQERMRQSNSDGLGLIPGRQTPYDGEAETKTEVDGHARSPGSARWGQYRFFSALGGGTGTPLEKPGNGNLALKRSHRNGRGDRSGGAPAKLHLSVLHGNIVRIIALFHFPLTILSVWGFQSHNGAHSTNQRALAAAFFGVVCVLIPLYVVVRIARSTSEELYEDKPTFIQLGPMYNAYAPGPGTQKYIVALFVWTLVVGTMIGAAEASGSAQAIVLLAFEIAMSVGSSLLLPWGDGSHMGPVAFMGSVMRIITAVLLVLLSPVVGFGPHVAGWITYVILLVQAIWFVGAFFIVAVKVVELLVRIGFNVPYEEGARTKYGGLEGAIRQIRRRQDKILQLGSGLSQSSRLRRPASRGSTGSVLNMASSPGLGPISVATAANKPIRLTHSRQVSYASYLDNPRMNQQGPHRMSHQDSSMYGPYAGYFQPDPHDEGGIMAAMPSPSPGLHPSSSPMSWAPSPASAPTASPTGAVPLRPQSAQALHHQGSGGGGGGSPPTIGFVRVGGGRATDAQPWQSIPGTAVTARPMVRPTGSPSNSLQPRHIGSPSASPSNSLQPRHILGLPEGQGPGLALPSAATAAAVAAARRGPRPQSQSAIVEHNWGEQASRNTPSPSPRRELVTLPDHRSSFNALAQANKAAQATQTGSDAATSGGAVGASGAAAAAQKRLETKKEGRTGGGGGFWMRTKRNRGKSGSGADADNSFDEDDDDEEDEEDEGHDPRSNGKPPGAGNNNNSAGSGSMWSGFKNVVGGLRPNAARRIVGRERNVADDGSVGHGLDAEDDGTAPKQSGFEVVRKPRRSPVVQPSGPPQPGPSSATNAVTTAPSSSGVGATSTQPQPQAAAAVATGTGTGTGTGTAASASPVGDGSLPPLTDLGRLNAGLGLDFNASLVSSDSAGTPRGSLLTAAQHAAFGQTTTTVPAPVTSSGAELGSERKPASDDPNFWRT